MSGSGAVRWHKIRGDHRTVLLPYSDIALGEVSRAVGDWSGGTRIGATISEFNLRWSRRVLELLSKVVFARLNQAAI
jgi:hypothetical protein